MKTRRFPVVMLASIIIFMASVAIASEPSPDKTYSGDWLTRSTLTGNWGGVRNDLAQKGITLDLKFTQVLQGVVDGGKDSSWESGGRGNLLFHLDTQKLGLWPGGFLTVEVEGSYGDSVNAYTGAILPVDTNRIFPTPAKDRLSVPAVQFTQFLSHYIGLYIGKLDVMASGDMNEFAHGKGDEQFMNLAFGLNPALLMTAPPSTLGAGVIILPTKDPNAAIINLGVLSATGEAYNTGFDTLNSDSMSFSMDGRLRTNIFGLTGHQMLGGVYSNKNHTSLDQRLIPLFEGNIEEKTDCWTIYYNFDQYLYEFKKGSGRGIGVFGRFGISDGNPSIVHHFYSLGIGGKGVMESRPADRFGVGWYYADIANPTIAGPFKTRSFLRDEQGFEAYYTIAMTPWALLTPDIQIVRPAQKERVSGEDVETNTILALRLQLIF
jgi:porin